ncbi:MAG TPA: alpha/beta hydrolase [Pyrinomonadaceae bacterium]|nr:alpha/beta hydrolase [Pyrinomonadaceae bacterium]
MRTKSKTTFNVLAICLLAFAQAASARANSANGAQTNGATTNAASQNIAGEWRGTLSAQGAQLRLVLKLAQSPSGALNATLDSPDQNASDLPLENIKFADHILSFEFKAGAAPAIFEGAVSRDGTEIAGFWQQGAPLPLVFTRELSNNTQPNAGNAQPSANVTTAAASFKRGRVELQPCGLPNITKDALCGQYEVFENRDAKSGRRIKLNLLVLPALADKPAPDPIFYLAGGPGGGATFYANASFILPLHRTRDVVLLDQRGTGKSNPLRCQFRGDPAEMNGYFSDRLTPEAVRACRAELEKTADLRLYTTTIAMADLDEVRQALGYGKINVYGGSYGSTAALAYLHLYPQNVRTVTVMGVAPLDLKLPLSFGKGVEHALERLFADCEADASCHRSFPDVRKEFAAVVERLDKGPVTFDTLSPFTGKRQQVTMTRTGFIENVRLMLYLPDVMALMPLLIHQAYQQDFGYFGLVGYQVFRAVDSQIARGMQLSVMCAEDIPFVTDAEIKERLTGTLYGDTSAGLYRKACAEWPRGEVPANFAAPIKSDIPVLMLSGELDPVTPPELATPLLRSLPNGRQVILRNATHNTYDCAEGLARDFIERGTTQGLDASCAEQIKRLPFTTTLPPLPIPK